ncbi:MAG TPA: Ig-like domain-containing protein, partial [Candidatus Sulfomarinibacteraceae bacterium]|nr:Ig-like domain-containing protein [Candidatus Sulfomarinibacteraceae bacterium]
DSFTWRVSDGIAESNTATVSITVQNQAPLAESNNYTTARGASVVVQLQYSDPDQAPGPYTFIIVDQPQHGALSGTGAERTYTPASGYVGSDSFTWRVNDGVSDSNLATITINVVEEEQWIYLPLIFKSSP